MKILLCVYEHCWKLNRHAVVDLQSVQVLLTLPVNWDALRESGLANSVYKGGVLSHPNRGVKTLAESLCKQWSDAAPNKKFRCACMLLKAQSH